MEPFTAAVLAVAVLSEPVSGLQVAGGTLLLGAVAALHLIPSAAAPPPGARRDGA